MWLSRKSLWHDSNLHLCYGLSIDDQTVGTTLEFKGKYFPTRGNSGEKFADSVVIAK